MKPNGAIESVVTMDLSAFALEDAALKLGPPLYTVTCHPMNLKMAMRICTQQVKDFDMYPLSTPVTFKTDDTFDLNEWTLEYQGKVFWSPGA